MPFPIHRSRRLRKSSHILRLVRENSLLVDDLICPYFVCEGKGVKDEIVSMPGNKFLKHALEWDYFMGVISFYLLTFFMWKKK